MAAKDYREKSIDELKETVEELRRTLFDHEFKHGTRQLTDTAILRRTKREIAQVLTVIREKEIEAAKAA